MQPDTSRFPIDWTTLENVVAQTASAEERQLVDQLLQEHPEIQVFLDIVRQRYAMPPRRDEARSVSESLAALSSRLDTNEQTTAIRILPAPALTDRGSFWTRNGWKSAIRLSLGVCLLILGWQAGMHRVDMKMSQQSSTYTTANGQQASILLPDGSRALLNVGSRLQVPTNFGVDNRTLTLTGEALFTVVHSKQAPFVVRSGPHTTRVLGTSFVVRRYADDRTTLVAVRDGRVAVDSVVISAQQRAEIGPHGVSALGDVDASAFSFSAGVLILNGVRLPDAIPQLNRWYNVDIRLGDPALASLRFEGKLPAGSIADLISLLDMAFNIQAVRDGQTLTLYPRT